MKVHHNIEELGKTICPFTFSVTDQYRDDVPVRKGGPWSCAGPACMAWRFARTHINGPGADLVPSDDTHGFCGLVGMP